MSEYITEWYWDETRNAPNQAQREEIVRCRDCRHGHMVKSGITGQIERRCSRWFDMLTEPDGYCHKGERRER